VRSVDAIYNRHDWESREVRRRSSFDYGLISWLIPDIVRYPEVIDVNGDSFRGYAGPPARFTQHDNDGGLLGPNDRNGLLDGSVSIYWQFDCSDCCVLEFDPFHLTRGFKRRVYALAAEWFERG